MNMRRFILWLLALLSFTATVGARPKSHVQVELLSAQSAVQPGQTQSIALHFQMDPEWHLYWTNPGAAGYAPRVKWKLPPGFQVGEPAWPVPKRLTVAGITGFVYEHELLLTYPLTVPARVQGSQVTLSGEVEWLACSETCVPGHADVQLQLPVGSASPSAQAAMFKEARDRLPEDQGNIELRAWRLNPETVFLEFRGMPGDKADWFPLSETDNVEGKEPVWKADQGVEIPVPKDTAKLAGLLVTENASGRHGVRVEVPIADKAPASDASGTPGGMAAPASGSFTVWTALVSAFLGGMVLNLMPCVFPVLSLKAISLVQHNEERRPQWAQGWVYTLGVLISVWLIAAPILLVSKSGDRLGWGWQMQSPLFVFGLATLFLAIALNLFGLFEVGEKLTQLASVAEGKKGLSEAFWSGAVATIAATPCTAPFMAGAVGYAVLQPAFGAFAIFSALGFGIAFPYLVLCGVPAARAWLPRPGAWMETFKQLMGFPMLLAMIWFLYILANLLVPEGLALAMAALVVVSLGAWVYGRWAYSPEGSVRLKARLATLTIVLLGLVGGAVLVADPSMQAGQPADAAPKPGELTWMPYSAEALEKLRAEKKPVFIDFTAAWCVNCKANEKLVLARSEVVDAFKQHGIVTMKADWTRRDPAITAALQKFGRTGVPFYVVYPRSGDPIPLPEVLTPQVVLEALARV